MIFGMNLITLVVKSIENIFTFYRKVIEFKPLVKLEK